MTPLLEEPLCVESIGYEAPVFNLRSKIEPECGLWTRTGELGFKSLPDSI